MSICTTCGFRNNHAPICIIDGHTIDDIEATCTIACYYDEEFFFSVDTDEQADIVKQVRSYVGA